MEQTLLLIIAFFGIAGITGAVLMLVRDSVRQRRTKMEDRLTDTLRTQMPSYQSVMDVQGWRPGMMGALDRWFGRIVAETGLGLTTEAAFMLCVAVGLVCGGVLFIWRDNPLAGIAGMETGMLAVVGFLFWRRAKRRRDIQEQLPDLMELLARAVRAGESIDQAVHLAADTIGQPLAGEFKRCAKQLDMGLALDVAFRSMARRTPLPEMRILAATITVQRQSGGNLPQVLERLVHVVRDRIAFHRQFRATTAAGRVSTLIIAVAAPLVAAYLFTWQYDYVRQLLEKPIGRVLISTSIILQIVGLLWTYYILSSDY